MDKEFLVSVADVYGYDANDVLLFVGKTSLDTSIETTLSNTDVRAGKGNQLQYIYTHFTPHRMYHREILSPKYKEDIMIYLYRNDSGEIIKTLENEAEAEEYSAEEYGVFITENLDLYEYDADRQVWIGKMTLDDHKYSKLDEIKAEYEAERTTRNKGIDSVTLGVKIDCREKDVHNIQSIVYVYDATGMAPTFYKAYDNSEVPATGDDFKNVLNELIAAQQGMWVHKNELSKQIAEATTPEQIKSIKWIW